MPYSAEAQHDHAHLQVLLKLFAKVLVLCPAMVLSVENPVGKFHELLIVQHLAAKPGWFLLHLPCRGHHGRLQLILICRS